MESFAGVEDLDSDEATVFPIEDGGRVGAFGCWRDDGVAAGAELVAGEEDVGRVGVAVVGDAHDLILLCWSARSWRKTTSDRRRLRQHRASFGVLPSSRLRS